MADIDSSETSITSSSGVSPVVQLVSLVAFSLMMLLFASCVGGNQPPEQASDFQVTLFNGSTFQLSQQMGRSAVVLNFWFPSCPPCRAEMPDFEESWQQVKGEEDIMFLGLFVPQGFDTEQDARDFVEELGLTYDFATDAGAQITKDYRIAYFPTSIFIDKEGRLVRTEISTLDTEKLTDIIRDMS